jgi:hypothetical protein
VTRDRFDDLRKLAELKAERSAATYARLQAAIRELEARAEALRAPVAPPSDIAGHLAAERHEAWRRTQLRRLSIEIAGRRAHAEPLRRAHARDQARAQVVARLLSGDKT